uniref:DNA-directed RNA polymerase RpoA/D/Rpb3-type domain-containing protein n=1 Tax=Solanum lycopersicum TaxID=4081 RepID=K4AUS5_SOLLC
MVRQNVTISTQTLQWKCVESRTDSKQIVMISNLYGTSEASMCVKGPGYVTAQGTILPSYVEIVDNTQHTSSSTEPIDFCIGLQIDRNHGYLRKIILSIGNGNEKQEILFIEIWTNGYLTPKEALHDASRNLIDLFFPFLHIEEDNLYLQDNQHTVPLSPFTFHEKLAKKIVLKLISIDQSELSSRIYNCLKMYNIYIHYWKF